MVVGPRLLEPVGQQFDRLRTVAGEDQKSSRCGAESTYHPKNIFHCNHSSVRFRSDLTYGVARRLDAVKFPRVCRVSTIRSLSSNQSCGYTLSMDSVRFGRALGIGKPEGFVKMIADATTDEILGVHIISANASDLIAEAVVAMEFKAASEDIGMISHPHPSLSEVMREAALAVQKRALNM